MQTRAQMVSDLLFVSWVSFFFADHRSVSKKHLVITDLEATICPSTLDNGNRLDIHLKSLHVPTWVLSRYTGFRPQSTDMHNWEGVN